ncbi:MAG TPA: PDZ domain-containing protein [Gemmatimonadaceae bacterium]|nr:PDZ domain-containing protein [Gemmatimonadaceae bacterium]
MEQTLLTADKLREEQLLTADKRREQPLLTADKLREQQLLTADKRREEPLLTADKRREQPLLTADKRRQIRIVFAASLIILAAMIPRPASGQEPIKGWVGVAYTTGAGEMNRDGMLVFSDYPVIESIEPNSPAERAGLQAGDRILAMNSQDLKRSPLPITSMIQPGRKIVFLYKRNDDVRKTTVTVVERPEGSAPTLRVTVTGPGMPVEQGPRDRATQVYTRRPLLVLPPMMPDGPRSVPVAGAEITALNAGLRALVGLDAPGIFVVNVAAGSIAGQSGLRQGDVILRAARERLGEPEDLIKMLREAQNESIQTLQLHIIRMKKPQIVTLRW